MNQWPKKLTGYITSNF